MRLFTDCFQGLCKFQGEPYYIEVDPSVPSKMTLCIQDINKQQSEEMQAAVIFKPVDHATPWINCFVIVNKQRA